MIIKKSSFKYSRTARESWPFSVPEITVMAIKPDKSGPMLFAIVHNFGCFALSGALTAHSFEPLESSGIWAPIPGHPTLKRNLTLFFRHVEQLFAARNKAILEKLEISKKTDKDVAKRNGE